MVMVSAKKRVGGVEFTTHVHIDIRVNLLTTLFIIICVMWEGTVCTV